MNNLLLLSYELGHVLFCLKSLQVESVTVTLPDTGAVTGLATGAAIGAATGDATGMVTGATTGEVTGSVCVKI